MSASDSLTLGLFNGIIVGGVDYAINMIVDPISSVAQVPFLGNIDGKLFSAVQQGLMAFFNPQIEAFLHKVVPASARGAAVESAIFGPIGIGILTAGADSIPLATGFDPIPKSNVRSYNDALQNGIRSATAQSMGRTMTKIVYPMVWGRNVPPNF